MKTRYMQTTTPTSTEAGGTALKAPVIRPSLLFVTAMILACSCGNNTTQPTAFLAAPDSLAEDSTMVKAEAKEQMPMGGDELFDDFFFNFASNRKLQTERTEFPLLAISNGDSTYVKKSEWKYEPFFIDQDYYTLIFDDEEQEAYTSDTTVTSVVVERFSLDSQEVSQYFFSRESGRWMLCSIVSEALPRNANAQFISFYLRFVTDSVFQHQSLSEQIMFVGPDPEDDFAQMEGLITPDFWEAFRPELPSQTVYNIVYGHQNPASTQKIFLIRGIANGQEIEMTFRQRRGVWKLTRLYT